MGVRASRSCVFALAVERILSDGVDAGKGASNIRRLSLNRDEGEQLCLKHDGSLHATLQLSLRSRA